MSYLIVLGDLIPTSRFGTFSKRYLKKYSFQKIILGNNFCIFKHYLPVQNSKTLI